MELGLFVVVGVAVAVIIGYVAWQASVRRREVLRAECLRHGWHHVGRDDTLVDRFADAFALFCAGERPRRCHDVVVAEHGELDVTFADYSYTTSSTDGEGNRTTSTVRHGVAIALLPGELPDLKLTRESAFSRVGSALGFRDVEVGHPDFDRRFRVKGHPGRVTEVLSPALVHTLLHQPYDHWELTGRFLLVARKGRWAEGERTAVLALLDQIVSSVPHDEWS